MLCEIIPKIAREEFEEKEGMDSYRHRPSNAGPERCVRQMVYHALGVEKKALPGRTVLVFDDGNWHEELSLDWLRKSAYKVHSQQMAFVIFDINGFPVKGSIDSLITDAVGKDYLLEHKAINHFTWQRYYEGHIVPWDYICQSCMYLKGVRQYNPDVEECVLLVKNKNTAAYMEFIVRYDDEKDEATIKGYRVSERTGDLESITFDDDMSLAKGILKRAEEKFLTIDKCLKEKKLPPRQYEYGNWRCDYCAWGAECWKGYDAQFKQRQVAAEIPEMEETLGEVFMYGRERAAFAKMETEAKKALSLLMAEKNIQRIDAGEFTASVAMRPGRKIDKTPPEIKAKYQETGKPYEVVSVKERKIVEET